MKDDDGDDVLTLQTFRSVTSTFLAARSRWITCRFTIQKIYNLKTSLSWNLPFLRRGIPSLEPRDGRTGSSLGTSASGSNLDKRSTPCSWQDHPHWLIRHHQVNRWTGEQKRSKPSRSSTLTDPSSPGEQKSTRCSRSFSSTDPSSAADAGARRQCLVSGFATLPLSFPPINFSSLTFLNFLGQQRISQNWSGLVDHPVNTCLKVLLSHSNQWESDKQTIRHANDTDGNTA